MAFPTYIPCRTVTVGGAVAIESGNLLALQATVKATRSLVWDATGFRFESVQTIFKSETEGGEVSFPLPVTDAAGWRDAKSRELIDVSAADSYSHLYTLIVVAGGNQYSYGPFSLPAGDGSPVDLDTLIPTSTVAGGAVSVPDSWSTLVQQAQQAASDAAASAEEAASAGGVTDAALAAHVGTGGAFDSKLSATIAHAGQLPVVTITLDGGADPVDKTTYLPGSYTITEPGKGVTYSGTLSLKGRGNSTWALPKKPWRVQFTSKTSPLSMAAKQKNWALLAGALDPSKADNAFAFALGAKMTGLAWTPQDRQVELVLNGTYRGVYDLTDLVRMESGRVPGTPPTADGDGSDGSWLLEISNKERPGSSDATGEPGFATAKFDQYIFYDVPDGLNPTQAAWGAAKVNAFEVALQSGDWATVDTLADVDSFIDWWLVNELIYNADSDFFSSCKLQIQNGRLAMGPMWDQDLSLGQTVTRGVLNPSRGLHTMKAAWLAMLSTRPDWAARVQARWAALLAAFDSLGGYGWFDAHTASVARPAADDDRRWNNVTYLAAEIDRRKAWMADRIAWLGGYIAGAPGYRNVALTADASVFRPTPWVEQEDPGGSSALSDGSAEMPIAGSPTLKVVTGGLLPYEGARLPGEVTLGPGDWTVSFMVRAVTDTTLRVNLAVSDEQKPNPTDGAVSIIGGADWQRVSVPWTLTGKSNASLYIDTGPTTQATTYYLAQLQIEPGTAVTEWAPGLLS